VPRLPDARISTDVTAYARLAPLPWATAPPFDGNGGITYRAFFAASAQTLSSAREFVHEPPAQVRHFRPAEFQNWEAQHPPLYYAAMVPVYLATRQLDWASHLFALRMASYLLAWSGWLLGLYTAATALRRVPGEGAWLGRWALAGTAAWPVLLPMWFPEMARIGNDSLCALLMAAIWLVMVRAADDGLTRARGVALGVLFGLGALTKIFFVMAAGGLGAFVLLCAWRRVGPVSRPPAIAAIALGAVVMVAIAGWWYALNWRDHGTVFATWDTLRAQADGGVVAGLREKFSVFAWLRAQAALVTTMGWTGTWSLARPAAVFLAPIALVVLVLAAAYGAVLARRGLLGIAALPAWMAAPLIAGLLYHTLVLLARTGLGSGTPGYYLHILVAPLGAAIGIGLGAWWARPLFRRVVTALGTYAIAFAVAISWAQLLLFAGLLVKGGTKLYEAPSPLPPLLGVPEALARLRVLAFPDLAVVTWLAGGLCVVTGVVGLWRANSGPSERPAEHARGDQAGDRRVPRGVPVRVVR
jgi:hypothetical protein